MSDGKDRPGKGAADLEGLAKRFQDLWQAQMAASAADPEFMEMMTKWMGAFSAGGMTPPATPPGAPPAGLPGMPGAMDPAAWMASLQAAMAAAQPRGAAGDGGRNAAPPKAGAKATAAASGAGDVGGDGLERRLAALEQRLDRLEAAVAGKGGEAAKRPRRRKS